MKIIEWIKKLFLGNKESMLIESSNESLKNNEDFNERDKLAIEVAKSLYNLYKILESSKKEKIHFILRTKDKEISKSCRLDSIEQLIGKIKERQTIIGFELSTSWINGNDTEEEYNDKSKIAVKIFDEDMIKIDYQNETGYEMFDITLKNIEEIINNISNKIVEINRINRSRPTREFIDFGILGNYEFNDIQYRTNEELTEEQIQIKKREILNDYSKHLDEINKKFFYQIHDNLYSTDYNIWEYKEFEVIINKEMLPNNFYDLSDKEKRNILYLSGKYTENELWEKIQQTKPFWNLNNIKDDIKITNIVIDADYNHINIEFNGICEFFVAYTELSYDKDYQIKVFNPS